MTDRKPTSRERILAAAADLTRESGVRHLSLDAVASRAGISKGGLLYNFPTKAKLMQGLVESYIQTFKDTFEAAIQSEKGKRGSLIDAYLRLTLDECRETSASTSGILAAMVEDPDFLRPIKAFKRELLDRLKVDEKDIPGLLMSYLAVEGLRSMKFFDLDILTADEQEIVARALFADSADTLGWL